MAERLYDGPADAPRTLLLAHGAGQGMDAPFLRTVAEGVAAAGLRVVRFEFPYMQQIRASGRRRPPDRLPVLLDAYRAAVVDLLARGVAPGQLLIGGKSLGGRVASLVADECAVAGLVCLGYPFHPPRKPERLRTEHLAELITPTLICQGERDPFGGRDEVRGYRLSPAIRVHWLPDGDHDLKPRRASGQRHADSLEHCVRLVVDFARGVGNDCGKATRTK